MSQNTVNLHYQTVNPNAKPVPSLQCCPQCGLTLNSIFEVRWHEQLVPAMAPGLGDARGDPNVVPTQPDPLPLW